MSNDEIVVKFALQDFVDNGCEVTAQEGIVVEFLLEVFKN